MVNKKASVYDVGMIMVVLLIFAIVTYFSFQLFADFKENTADVIDSEAAIQIQGYGDTFLSAMDYLFVFALIGLVLTLIISAFMLQSHPAFFWITLIITVVFILLAGLFSNIFEDIRDQPSLAEAKAEYNVMNEIFDKFPTWILIISAIIALVLYAKYKFFSVNY